ncbi:hypothetical protein [Natronobacterium gregoryi]|uniref:Uncharacterized protein n=2 Tax=Natronobacterium gregoryi TaxID=44930 RepID=L0AN87_NATGS|nr:hypothetical protein [Natronobacterium gregoryi]AFZ74647.1 hypothetical protein Natgr_3529 [Natronobacterium gregoryi SP2]SFJ31260.1 hypothetical protein SAMN05443661_12166 [Natronobacterium gregoryi]
MSASRSPGDAGIKNPEEVFELWEDEAEEVLTEEELRLVEE